MGWILTQIYHILLLVIVLCSVCFSSFSVTTRCKVEEKTALLQFMSQLSFNVSSDCDPSHINQPWNEEDDCCVWDGVDCDDTTGHVTSLNLVGNCLFGNLPLNSSIFNLLHLEKLSFSGNNFNNSRVSPLFGNLKNLTKLYLDNCNLYGVLPNEIFNLRKLVTLDLSGNKRLTGKLPETIEGLESMQELSLRGCQFYGSIPTSIGKLRELRTFDISNNNFSGQVPTSISNPRLLTKLDLSYNNLQGFILPSIVNLTRCYHLDLSENNFTDVIDLNLFTNFSNLNYLHLSKSGISLTTSNSVFVSHLPKIENLGLSSCGLNSNILTNLSANYQLVYVDLSNNEIRGELDPTMCNLRLLYYLDLSNNQLNGVIPSCLGNSRTLSILNLGSNKFYGTIPQPLRNNIKVLDLSSNYLQGSLPRSLINCTKLEVLNLGRNILIDTFPFWFGSLSSLKVVILRENKLNGPLTQTRFANLHIIDMSHNDFTGTFLSHFFDSFNAMMVVGGKDASTYSSVQTLNGPYKVCHAYLRCRIDKVSETQTYNDYYTLNIMNKGSFLLYKRVLTALKVVDFSNNRLNGNIPMSIGVLKGIHVLNLSHNSLQGPIPRSIGNLTELESIDLSDNMLSGKIPQVLSNLGFLEVLNLSQNNLTGVIPGFLDRFENTSFDKNPGLCGLPLSKLCKPLSSPPSFQTRKKHRFTFDINGFGWEIVLIGYGCGMVFGLGIGSWISLKKKAWVARAFNL